MQIDRKARTLHRNLLYWVALYGEKQVGVVAVEHIGVIRMLRNQQKIQIFSTLVKKDAYNIEE